jgi:hypothetical protein
MSEPTREECIEYLEENAGRCGFPYYENASAAYLRADAARIAELEAKVNVGDEGWGRAAAKVGRIEAERDAAQARIAVLEAELDRERAAHRAASANAQDWADDAAGAKEERNTLAAEVEGLTAERDALAAIRCCETCGEIGDADCCCEWQCGDPDDCVAPGYAHWTQAPVESILRRKREFDEQQTGSAAAVVALADLTGEEGEA